MLAPRNKFLALVTAFVAVDCSYRSGDVATLRFLFAFFGDFKRYGDFASSTRRALYCSPRSDDISAANRKSARKKKSSLHLMVRSQVIRQTRLWTASILAFTLSFESLGQSESPLL